MYKVASSSLRDSCGMPQVDPARLQVLVGCDWIWEDPDAMLLSISWVPRL
jgi:hypothetical protein